MNAVTPDLSPADQQAMTSSVVKNMCMFMRAEDRSGAWESIPDWELIAPFIVTKQQKRELPLIGDPDPDIIWRVDMFYKAVSLAIEQKTGKTTQHVMQLNPEGWGRMAMIAGRLVVVNSYMRELHRFGFETVETLVTKAQKLIDEGVSTIEKFPGVADA